jgi:hypothetical protein
MGLKTSHFPNFGLFFKLKKLHRLKLENRLIFLKNDVFGKILVRKKSNSTLFFDILVEIPVLEYI